MATVQADPSARQYLARSADYNGRIEVPVLMLHNVNDPLTIVEGTDVYYEIVAAQGREDHLVRLYTTRDGHCNFTVDQVSAMFEAMDSWLDTCVAPNPEEDFSANLELDTDFEPDPWPQPPPN